MDSWIETDKMVYLADDIVEIYNIQTSLVLKGWSVTRISMVQDHKYLLAMWNLVDVIPSDELTMVEIIGTVVQIKFVADSLPDMTMKERT